MVVFSASNSLHYNQCISTNMTKLVHEHTLIQYICVACFKTCIDCNSFSQYNMTCFNAKAEQCHA